MGLSLAVYASICRSLGRPFVLPGSQMQWNGLTDVTDATILAEQMAWAATHAAGRDEAFNEVTGDVFPWRRRWPQLAAQFGVDQSARAACLSPSLVRCRASKSKSRLAGFTSHHRTIDSFTAVVERYASERLIPPLA